MRVLLQKMTFALAFVIFGQNQLGASCVDAVRSVLNKVISKVKTTINLQGFSQTDSFPVALTLLPDHYGEGIAAVMKASVEHVQFVTVGMNAISLHNTKVFLNGDYLMLVFDSHEQRRIYESKIKSTCPIGTLFWKGKNRDVAFWKMNDLSDLGLMRSESGGSFSLAAVRDDYAKSAGLASHQEILRKQGSILGITSLEDQWNLGREVVASLINLWRNNSENLSSVKSIENELSRLRLEINLGNQDRLSPSLITQVVQSSQPMLSELVSDKSELQLTTKISELLQGHPGRRMYRFVMVVGGSSSAGGFIATEQNWLHDQMIQFSLSHALQNGFWSESELFPKLRGGEIWLTYDNNGRLVEATLNRSAMNVPQFHVQKGTQLELNDHHLNEIRRSINQMVYRRKVKVGWTPN